MLARIKAALEARRRAMLEVEALVWRFNEKGVEMAETFAVDKSV